MPLSNDRKALLFLGAVAILGAGVRALRWSKSADSVADQAALEHQLGAADSAAHAAGRPRTKQKASRSRRATTRPSYKDATSNEVSASAAPPFPPREVPGFVLGKLDLDAATLAQIDALPGVGPTLAKRIVADRAEHGPFVTLQGLRRVKGVGPALLRRLDSLVTFSATLRPLNAGPESVSARPSRRVKR
jgi:competence protein ComEA